VYTDTDGESNRILRRGLKKLLLVYKQYTLKASTTLRNKQDTVICVNQNLLATNTCTKNLQINTALVKNYTFKSITISAELNFT
jgi:hypothetical protein